MPLSSAQLQVVALELEDGVAESTLNFQLYTLEYTTGVITLPQYTVDLTSQATYLAAYDTYLAEQIAGTQPFNPITYGQPICYLRGTHILTETGEVLVEDLKIGDMVVALSGAPRPVRWIGYRHFDLTRHPAPDPVRPIRIRANAFADGVPHRDLLLSPEHAVLRDGVLVPARLLVNGASIVRETQCSAITYYHVELDSHDILLAENLQAESYLDTGNRGFFQNSGLPLTLYPDLTNDQGRREAESCAPFADDPEQVEPVWRELAARAVQLGWHLPPGPETTDDPALHLIVDGRHVAPVSVTQGCTSFLLPRADAEVRLVSRSALPNETRPWVADDRRLGVMLCGLTLRSGALVSPIPLDHPAFGEGWWEAEWHGPTALRRWTNGDALVPMPAADLLPPGPCILEVETAAATLFYALPAPDGTEVERVVHSLTRAAA
jgi:Hint domain